MKMTFENKNILVTGGSGSIGSALCKKLLEYPIKALRIFDNDEYGLFCTQNNLNDNRVRPLLGNIQDKDRLILALKNVDIVIHTCALKNIAITEFNAPEVIKTNVIGTWNVVEAAIETKPGKVLFISSDKAVNLTSLYSASKLLGERLMLWAHKTQDGIRFSSCRFPNVIESRGNVFEVWRLQQKNNLPLTVTDTRMERYFMHVGEAVDFILNCLSMMAGGEIFVPVNIEKKNIFELAKTFSGNIDVTGARTGEVLEEELMTELEKTKAKRVDDIWVIRE